MVNLGEKASYRDTAFRTDLQGWISHSGKMSFQAVQ